MTRNAFIGDILIKNAKAKNAFFQNSIQKTPNVETLIFRKYQKNANKSPSFLPMPPPLNTHPNVKAKIVFFSK